MDLLNESTPGMREGGEGLCYWKFCQQVKNRNLQPSGDDLLKYEKGVIQK
jgi:hypothetical protein